MDQEEETIPNRLLTAGCCSLIHSSLTVVHVSPSYLFFASS